MGLDAMWQQGAYAGYQVWVWLRYEAGVHPFMFLGAVIVIVAALILYKTEVRGK
jgi:hypothetical protein